MPDILSFLHVVMENIVDAAILLFEFIGVGIIIFRVSAASSTT